MKHRHFIKQLDRKLIEAAIRDAERKTSGEIRVMVHHKPVEDAVAFAQSEFIRLGMQRTSEHNAVLFMVAPLSQKFAVVGDEAVHQKCGAAFWQELAGVMTGHFKLGEFTAGLLHGIGRAGTLLAEHFPHHPGDKNELPDQIIGQ